MAAPGGEDVYATLLLEDTYLPGALVLAHSLRDAGTTQKLAVLVTLDTVAAEVVTQLQTVFDYVIPVPRIQNRTSPGNLDLMNRPDLHSAFTKINLWKQVQFRKIVYIDADAVVYRAPDELFDLPHAFAAAPDIGWPDLFNTGVMVLTPDIGEYYALAAMADRGVSFDGADQGLLNMHFKDSYHRLPFTYNVTPSAHYQYLPAYRHFQSNITVAHFIGAEKPWFEGRGISYGGGPYDEMVGQWWSVYDHHYRAVTPPLDSHQQAPPEIVQYFVKGEFNPKLTACKRYLDLGDSSYGQHSETIAPPPPPQPFFAYQEHHSQHHLNHPPEHHHQPHYQHQHEHEPSHPHDGQPPPPPPPLLSSQPADTPHVHFSEHFEPAGQARQQRQQQQQQENYHHHHHHHHHQGQDHQDHQDHHDHGHQDHQDHQEHRDHHQEHGYEPHVPQSNPPPPSPPHSQHSSSPPPAASFDFSSGDTNTETREDQVQGRHAGLSQPPATGPSTEPSWNAQWQPPPVNSLPEALNFPQAHYEMSHDATPFVPPERYPSPPRDMWYQVPAEAPQRPAHIFPWENHQSAATRVFAEPGPPPQPASTNHSGSPSVDLKTEPTTPVMPNNSSRAPPSSSDPWAAFTRTNAWDEVPQIERYVDTIQKSNHRHRRVRSRGQLSGEHHYGAHHDDNGGHVGGGDGAHSEERRSSKVTDFPTEVERPSLPVTPAPIRRAKFWGGGGPGFGNEKGADGGEDLPAAQGVPQQADWDPVAQLQKLAKEQSEMLLQKLGHADGGAEGGGVEGKGDDPRSLAYAAQSTTVVSPRPVKPGGQETSSVRNIYGNDTTTAMPAYPDTDITEPSYHGPSVAFEKDEGLPTHEQRAGLPTEEEMDVLAE